MTTTPRLTNVSDMASYQAQWTNPSGTVCRMISLRGVLSLRLAMRGDDGTWHVSNVDNPRRFGVTGPFRNYREFAAAVRSFLLAAGPAVVPTPDTAPTPPIFRCNICGERLYADGIQVLDGLPHHESPCDGPKCRYCGVVLNPDGSVDALDEESNSHFAGCDRPTTPESE